MQLKKRVFIELKRNMTDDLVVVVAANKLDLQSQREVLYDDAQEYVARVLGPDTLLYEVSAKEDDGKDGIAFVFLKLCINPFFVWLPIMVILRSN